MDTVTEIYQFVYEQDNRPVRYFPEETQRPIEEMLAGVVDPDVLYMTEFMRLHAAQADPRSRSAGGDAGGRGLSARSADPWWCWATRPIRRKSGLDAGGVRSDRRARARLQFIDATGVDGGAAGRGRAVQSADGSQGRPRRRGFRGRPRKLEHVSLPSKQAAYDTREGDEGCGGKDGTQIEDDFELLVVAGERDH